MLIRPWQVLVVFLALLTLLSSLVYTASHRRLEIQVQCLPTVRPQHTNLAPYLEAHAEASARL